MSSQTKVTFWRQKVLHTLTMKSTQVFLAVLITYTYVLCADGEVQNTTATTTSPTTTTQPVFTVGSVTSRSNLNNHCTYFKCFTASRRNNDYFGNICSAKDSYLSCLNEGLPRTSKLNGVDFALSLNFDLDISSRRLESLCPQYVDIRNEPNCLNSTDRFVDCKATMVSGFCEILNVYQNGSSSLEDLRLQSCTISNSWESCLFKAFPYCSHKVRRIIAEMGAIGFTDKCNGGHNINSLSGLFIGLLFVCAMFSRVWSDM